MGTKQQELIVIQTELPCMETILPAGFQVTGLVRTVKTFAAAMGPGKLLGNWLSFEGAVTRWVIAVVDGSAVIVVLEAADWEQGKAVEGLLSRMRIY